MQKLFHTVGIALVAIGLYACNQTEKLATAPNSENATGSALIKLPDLPSGFLSKVGANTKTVFALTISGAGMQPIHQSWFLIPGDTESKRVDNIPAGLLRIFTGQIYQMDSTSGEKPVSYEGQDTVLIENNKTADVKLFLRNIAKGSANVCVSVEGLPDSTCQTPPPPKNEKYCYSISQIVKGSPGKTGRLVILGKDTSFQGTFRWTGVPVFTLAGVIHNSDGNPNTNKLFLFDGAPPTGLLDSTLTGVKKIRYTAAFILGVNDFAGHLLNLPKSSLGTWEGKPSACMISDSAQ